MTSELQLVEMSISIHKIISSKLAHLVQQHHQLFLSAWSVLFHKFHHETGVSVPLEAALAFFFFVLMTPALALLVVLSSSST
jgi:hypothetical protein